MNVLLTGGLGFIGSHTAVELINAGHHVVIYDNLCNAEIGVLTRIEKITGVRPILLVEDIRHQAPLSMALKQYQIDVVIHFAALKAVGESVAKPLEYYTNNLVNTLTVLNAMRRHGVKNFVFSSSATVYGDPHTVPIREDFPLSTTNPYGTTKLFIERILTDCCAADPTLNVALLRYFNPIGAHASGLIGEDPNGIPNNLVPYIAKVAVGQLKELHVFGSDWPTHDGTGVRDYIHVVDLARGHVAALKKLSQNCGLFLCNLGTGKGYSVLDVLHAYEKACGKPLPYVIDPRRPGDIAACWADPSKAREELGWEAQYGIEEMCASSWKWKSMNPNGYEG